MRGHLTLRVDIYNDGSFEITEDNIRHVRKATFVNLQSASLQDVTMTGGSELINEEGTVKANSLDTRSSYIYNRCRMEILSSTYFQNGRALHLNKMVALLLKQIR